MQQCAILVLSCDKYADLWKPFFHQFWKCWPDCPYPVYLGSNTRTFADKKVKTILSGPDKNWSSSLLAILNQIATPYVYIWLDDIFPVEAVDADRFNDAIEFMKDERANHIHVIPKPKPDSAIHNVAYGVYEKGAPYRVNALGFWNVLCLKQLLIPGESPWNFEVMGSYRSRYTDGFYCCMDSPIKTLHVIEKGRIFREAYDYCMSHNIPLDVKKRPVLESAPFFKSQLQKLYFNTVIRIPWKFRLSFMNLMRKLMVSY